MFKAIIALSLLLAIVAGVVALIRKMLRDKSLHEERMAQLVREDYQGRYMASIAGTSLSLRGARQLSLDDVGEEDDDDVVTESENEPEDADDGITFGNMSHRLSDGRRSVLSQINFYSK